jgi:hypothetical protein
MTLDSILELKRNIQLDLISKTTRCEYSSNERFFLLELISQVAPEPIEQNTMDAK